MKLLLQPFSWLMLLMMTSYYVIPMVSSEEYVAETIIVMDKVGVEVWEKKTGKMAKTDLETEIQSVMYEVNQIYKNVDDNVKIRFQLKELQILDKNVVSATLPPDPEIEVMTAANNFQEYLSLREEKTYDIALLFTGNKLYIGSNYIAKGFAKVDELCTQRSVGVVKYTGTFEDVLVTAHELAHIFNALHDDGHNCPQEGYLMTTYQQFLTEARYHFSYCSKTSILNKVRSFGGDNCLLKNEKDNVLEASRYGTLMTPDAHCKRRFNSLSYVSRQNYSSGYGDNVCLKLACRENTWNKKDSKWRTTFIPSPDGMYCGKNKQCFQGKCVVSKTGKASVSDTCPFGDQPVIEGDFPKGCGQVKPEDCHKFKDVCCQTCDDKNPEYSKTADDVCRELEGPTSQMLRLSYNGAKGYQEKLCSELSCLTEPHMSNGNYNRKVYKAPDGMACGKNKRCSDGRCVQSPNGNPEIKDSCPFGDQPFVTGKTNKSCDDIIWRTGCKTGWERVCCDSCTGKL